MKRNQYKHPRLYWQPTSWNEMCGRLRILYPNGKTEWMGSNPLRFQSMSRWRGMCCWQPENATMKELIKAMRKYDKKQGYPKAIFLGEIK